MITYQDFLKSKQFKQISSGFEPKNINSMLFDFQRDIVIWACKKGRAAIWADCGMGKTPMQLEWANQVVSKTSKSVLILAPLAIAAQTKREGEKFGVEVNICERQSDVKPGINITNYEKLEHFDASSFGGIVLDESSILKHFESKTRTQIIYKFKETPYKLACTATPAPNDYMELGNHAEFLGVMNRTEMLATYFVHDGGDTSKWRLKGHAEDTFWQWLASWAVVIRKPSDLGYDDGKYILPELNVVEKVVEVDGGDMAIAKTLTERRQARRNSLPERCQAAADIANATDEQFIVWCDLNDESAELTKLINGAVEVKGSDKPSHKEKSVVNFAKGDIRVIVSKPSICGFGINWQNCRNQIFVGLSDSYEAYYQAIRRSWRFGQEKEVNAYIIISEQEGTVKANIERKEQDSERMSIEMVKYTQNILIKEVHGTIRETIAYEAQQKIILPKWLEVA